MAGITSALCTSFKVELLEGDHDFNNGADTFKVALLKANASITGTYGAATTNYSDVTGNSDELTPEKACRNLFSKFFRNENKIFHKSLSDAHHGFDNPFLYFGFTFEKMPSLNITNKKCTLTISESGKIITLTNKEVSTPEASEYFLDRCSTKGVTVKYNAPAAEKTQKLILEFLSKNFIN